MRAKLRLLFLGANILLVLLTLGAYLAPHIPPQHTALFPILGLGYPVLLLCHLLSIILWILMRSRWVLLSAVTLLIGIQSCSRLIGISLPDKISSEAITVATFNANFSKPITLGEPDKLASREDGFIQYLRSLPQMDVLCVQEDGEASSRYLQDALAFPHRHAHADLTVSIYSALPILDAGHVEFSSTTANTCLWVDVVKGSDTLRIYTTHLESNRTDGVVPEVIHEDTPEHMSSSLLMGIVKHHQRFSIKRADQAHLIKAHQSSSPYPALICGDFNETPQSHVYHLLSEDMQDTFAEEGTGMASTFGERIPALRIDHVLVDKRVDVLRHDIHRSGYSDHYLVEVVIAL